MQRARRRQRFLWMSSMAGSGVPVMRWAVFTTLCSALQSATEQFPYHTDTVGQDAFDRTPVEVHEDGWRQVVLLQCPKEEEALVSLLD